MGRTWLEAIVMGGWMVGWLVSEWWVGWAKSVRASYILAIGRFAELLRGSPPFERVAGPIRSMARLTSCIRVC